MGTEPVEYCREIETYLCRKNDGHLIRVVGPSFERVSAWAAQGVPLKVAFKGIDRYFERYYSKGPRRRPVKIDFCEADVLDVFDEWRRATGVTSVRDGLKPVPYSDRAGDDSDGVGDGLQAVPRRSAPSLRAHLARAVMRLTSARANGTLDHSFDALLDRVSQELDAARGSARGLRGEARRALLDRLAQLDVELLEQARGLVDSASSAALAREADAELAPFRSGLTADAVHRAHQAAIDRLVRERFGLPTIAFP